MSRTILFVLLLAAAPAGAWGPVGHRVVGKIAENHLTPEAKSGLKELMGSESLARASTWADEVRSHPDRAYFGKFDPWHYATVPLGETYKDEHAPGKKGDIMTALRDAEQTLRSKTAERREKVEALRLLTHFIGDVHQPMHVGNGKDFGGNTCFVKWFGSSTKLHALWDESLIDHLKLSYSEYAEFLDSPTTEEVESLQKTTYVDWANESVEIRPGVYPGTEKPEDRKYCVKGWSARPDTADMPDLKWDYAFKHRKTLDSRLLAAGVRLAGVLNSIFK